MHPVDASILLSLLAILVLLLSVASAFGYGGTVLRWFRPETDNPLQACYAVALGLGILAYLVLAAGLLGVLQPAVLAGEILVGCGLAVPVLRRFLAARKSRGNEDPKEAAPAVERYLTLLASGFVGLLALASLFAALHPLDGLDWDGLSYHLAAPKIFLRAGRIVFIAYDSHTDFPFTMEMLYTVGLAFAGPAGAKLFHWAAGWLTALAVGIWARRLRVGDRRMPDWAGPLAAALFGGIPVVLWEMGTAYVDLGTALFQFLAFTALVDGWGSSEGKPRVRAGAAALAGAFSGFALGTKYTALLQFGLLGLGLCWGVVRTSGAERAAMFRALLGFSALGVVVAAPWYVKNWLWVHNPVYPFAYGLFPHSFSWSAENARAYTGEQSTFGVHYVDDLSQWLTGAGMAAGAADSLARAGSRLLEAILLPWNLAMHGRAFYINLRTVTGDKLGSIGPWWVGMLPLCLWARGLTFRVRAAILYGLGSVVLWFFLSQQVRYLIPPLAPLAVVGVALLVGLRSPMLRLAAGVFTAIVLFLNLAIQAPFLVNAVQVTTGQVSEAEYLQASLPGLYEAAGYVNQLPAGSRIALYQETRGFYFDRSYFWANPLQHELIPYNRLGSGAELVGYLRRFGITHVLINYDFCSGVQESPWYKLLMDAIRTGKLVERFRSEKKPTLLPRGVMVYEIR